MSLARSTPPTPNPTNSRRLDRTSVKLKDRPIERKVESIDRRAKKIPKWLYILALTQKTTSIASLILLAITGGLYALTYSIPQKWSEQYAKLENLQRIEREATAIDETYKYQYSKEAQQQNSGLVAPTPERAIFLKPTKVNSNKKEATKTAKDLKNRDSLQDSPFSY